MKPRHSIAAVAVGVLLIVPLAACSGGGSGDARAGGSSSGGGAASEQYGAPAPESAMDTAVSEEGASPEAGKSIISTGDVSIIVSDTAAGAEEVSDAVRDLGGSVESQEVSGETGTTGAAGGDAWAHLVVRVPADRFDAAFDALAKIGEVTAQSRSATDVTTEHVDLQARVASLEKAVQRLSDLMAGADSTSELLDAEAALSQRQQELDGLTAQLQALEGQVAESTISVSLSTRSALPGGGPANFWEGLLAGFSSLGAAGSGALVLAGLLLPWLVVAGAVAVIVLLIVRSARRRRARRGTSAVRDADGSPRDGEPRITEPSPSAPDTGRGTAPDPDVETGADRGARGTAE